MRARTPSTLGGFKSLSHTISKHYQLTIHCRGIKIELVLTFIIQTARFVSFLVSPKKSRSQITRQIFRILQCSLIKKARPTYLFHDIGTNMSTKLLEKESNGLIISRDVQREINSPFTAKCKNFLSIISS